MGKKEDYSLSKWFPFFSLDWRRILFSLTGQRLVRQGNRSRRSNPPLITHREEWSRGVWQNYLCRENPEKHYHSRLRRVVQLTKPIY